MRERSGIRKIVGEIYAEGPPVPIPNTEVKLCRAEDTWLATARENRYSPTLRQRLAFPLTSRSFYSSIAQSVERAIRFTREHSGGITKAFA